MTSLNSKMKKKIVKKGFNLVQTEKRIKKKMNKKNQLSLKKDGTDLIRGGI